jgi:hypothetical protein
MRKEQQQEQDEWLFDQHAKLIEKYERVKKSNDMKREKMKELKSTLDSLKKLAQTCNDETLRDKMIAILTPDDL